MYSRLVLLRNLLTEDGSIWISIDADECAYLKVLCDEVFGRTNYKTTISWQRKYSVSNNFRGIATINEYILVYSKSREFSPNLLPRTQESTAIYANPDDDLRGPWKAVDYLNQATTAQRPNLCYDIINPFTGATVKNGVKAWKYEYSTHLKHVVTVPFRLALLYGLFCPPAHPPKLTPNALPTGLVQRMVRQRLSIVSLKNPPNYPGPPQKDNKKEPRAIRNELLWALIFYSVLALNAAHAGTKLGAELGWFWVGQAQGVPEKFIFHMNYSIKHSKKSSPTVHSQHVVLNSGNQVLLLSVLGTVLLKAKILRKERIATLLFLAISRAGFYQIIECGILA